MKNQTLNLVFKQIEYNTSEWVQAVRLRERILRGPLGSEFTKQELNDERNHIQIAGFLNDELVATAVLVVEEKHIKMQRVAVTERLQSTGIGSQLLGFCEQVALAHKAEWMYCHARDSAVNFYNKNGYVSEGDYFNEDGIPHLKMKKAL